jgi:hypothetical protein
MSVEITMTPTYRYRLATTDDALAILSVLEEVAPEIPVKTHGERQELLAADQNSLRLSHDLDCRTASRQSDCWVPNGGVEADGAARPVLRRREKGPLRTPYFSRPRGKDEGYGNSANGHRQTRK